MDYKNFELTFNKLQHPTSYPVFLAETIIKLMKDVDALKKQVEELQSFRRVGF